MRYTVEQLESMTGMLLNCQAQYIDLSSFDTSNVTNIDGMFKGCKAQVKTTDTKILTELNKR